MRGTSHLVIGATTGLILSQSLEIGQGINPLIVAGLAIIGSITPDLDAKKSIINRALFPVKSSYRNTLKTIIGLILVLIPETIVRYLGAIILLSVVSNKVEYRFNLFSGFKRIEMHRTLFHDPILGTLLFIIPLKALGVEQAYTLAFMIGVISHYIADMFNTYGLPLYLLGGKRIRMPFCYNINNKYIEYVLVSSYVLIALYQLSDFIGG